jgi:Flp pilus assembly protein TadD
VFWVFASPCRGSDEALFQQAYGDYNQGQYARAEAHLLKALELNPAYVQAQSLLTMVRQKQADQQSQDLRFIVLMQQGVLYYRMRQYDKAISLFDNAASLKDSADLHFNLGLVYLKLKDWKKAEAELEKCLKLKPGDKRAEYALGVLYEKAGAAAAAQNYFLMVAQSPNAEIYNAYAMQRLSTLQSNLSNSPFHFSARLQEGRGDYTLGQIPGSAVPTPVSSGTQQYVHLQLGYSLLWGKTIVNFAYGGDGIWNEPPGQSTSFDHLHDFSVGASFPVNSKWIIPLAFDEQIGFASDTFYYEHHQASAAVQWLFQGPDLIQAQFQFLREIYPPPVGINTDSWIATFSGSLLLWGAHYLNLAYCVRMCLADTFQTDSYNYFLNSFSLTYHVELGGGWNATVNFTPQWQDFPFFYDSNLSPRSDWIQNWNAEFAIPVNKNWNFVVGDIIRNGQSSISAYTQYSNNYYAGTQVFF